MNDDLYAPSESAFEQHGQGPRDLSRGPGSFSLGRAYNEGGEVFQINLGIGIGGTIVAGVLLAFTYILVAGFIGLVDVMSSEFAVVVLILVGMLGGGLGYYLLIRLLQAGLQLMGMNMVRGQGQIEDLFRPFFRPGRLIAAVLILYLVQILLPLLVVVPGTMVSFFMMMDSVVGESNSYLAESLESAQSGFFAFGLGLLVFFLLRSYMDARLCLVAPLILEGDMRVMEAIQMSWRRTAPHQFSLATLFGLNELLFLMSLLCCGVGALFSVPFHYATLGSATLQLLGDGSDPDDSTDGEPQEPAAPSANVNTPGSLPGDSTVPRSPDGPANPYA